MATTFDFYDALGVSRTSEDVVIRAAYLALMRRYHPDGNPSPQAAERVRTITTAYAVLGDPAKRREYDLAWQPGGRSDPARPRKPMRTGPLLFAATMLCMGLLILVIWAGKPPGEAGHAVLATANANGAAGPPADLSCLSDETKALLPPELIRRAANLSRTSRVNLAGFSGAMSVRSGPAITMAQPRVGFVECAASVTVQPPDDQGAGNNPPLLGDVDFTIGAREGGGVALIEFNPDDRFLIDLASLGRASERPQVDEAKPTIALDPPPAVSALVRPARATTRRLPAAGRPSASAPPIVAERVRRPAATATASPAVASCGSGRGAARPCADHNLPILDQQLAIFERQSLANSGAARRDALSRTQVRFETARRKCGDEACTRKLILSRSREIADIMRAATDPQR